ncbi:MAG: hypothetical protein R3E66_15575 [bacterium]
MIWDARVRALGIWLRHRHTVIAKSAPSAAVVNHLWPLMIHVSASRTATVSRTTGLEPAFWGSVIEKQLRTFPSTSGAKYLALLGRAELVESPSLPASGLGNWLKLLEGLFPKTSLIGANSVSENPAPPCSEDTCGEK